MSLVQNWKFFICLFLDILGLEIMSDEHLVTKQVFLDDKKKSILNSRRIEIFSKWVSPRFWSKIGNYLLAFEQNGPEKMLNDHLVGKQCSSPQTAAENQTTFLSLCICDLTNKPIIYKKLDNT